MALLQLVGDFETNNDENNCRVWASCLVNIEDNKVVHLSNNIDDLFKYLNMLLKYTSVNIYFHNLKFDGEFILYYLLKNGYTYNDNLNEKNCFKTLITETGAFYQFIIKNGKGKNANKITIYDSLKIIPLKVKVIAESFNLHMKKGSIDYDYVRPLNHTLTEEEKEYIIDDCKIVAGALKQMFDEGLTKMTIASNAFSFFKTKLGSKKFNSYFPNLDCDLDKEYKEKYKLSDDTIDEFIRKSYKGGYVYANPKYTNKIIKNGITLDVNSLYPSRMKDEILPYDLPVFYEGEYNYNENYPLYIQRLKCKFNLKRGYNPIIQIKGNCRFKDTEYLTNSGTERVELTVTNVDLELIKEHYKLSEVEYICGFMFKGKKGIFDDYINYWGEIKKNNKGGKRQIAKLMLNSLYGKFATNPKGILKVPVFDYLMGKIKLENKIFENENIEFLHDKIIVKERASIYTAMASFITAYARKVTITAIHKNWHRFCYADTDSIHLIGYDLPTDIEIHPKKLGAWAHESSWYYGKFIRAKTYMEEVIQTFNKIKVENYIPYKRKNYDILRYRTLDVKCAGMPDSCKKHVNKYNFKQGLTLDKTNIPLKDCKLSPKRCGEGVVLIKTSFTIK